MPSDPTSALRRGLSRQKHLAASAIALLRCALFGFAFAAAATAAAEKAERIVSLSPEASEVLIALGAGPRVVAVDAESARLPTLHGLPVAATDELLTWAPDLVILPARSLGAQDQVTLLRRQGIDVLPFAPHDFDDAAEFCRTLGVRLDRSAAAHTFARASTQSLALLSRESFGRRRPRIAAVIGFEPLTLAGGHSFLTDLIEAAGAENVTHGIEEPRVVISAERLASLGPEWILVATPHAVPSDERRRLNAELAFIGPLEYLVVAPERIWLHESERLGRELRGLVCERAQADPSVCGEGMERMRGSDLEEARHKP